MTKTIYGLNLKNIVDDFQLLANRHKQINSFGFGDLDEFTYQVDRRDKEVNLSDQAPYYPYLYVVPANVIQDFGFMTFEFNLIVSDIMKRDMDNMTDVLSDTLQIMNDVISMFRLSVTKQLGDYNKYYYLDDAVTMVPFIEQYEDLLCGYSATIRIKTKTYLDRCVAAFEDFPIDPCNLPTPTPTPTQATYLASLTPCSDPAVVATAQMVLPMSYFPYTSGDFSTWYSYTVIDEDGVCWNAAGVSGGELPTKIWSGIDTLDLINNFGLGLYEGCEECLTGATPTPTPSVTQTPTNTTTPTSTPTQTPTPTTPLTYSVLTLCTTNGVNGFPPTNDSCSGTCTPRTVYVPQTGVTTFQQAAITYGLPIYTSPVFIPANLYNGNSLWFGTTDKSEIFQVDNDGAMSLFGTCPT